jgi:hypothetical protein
VKLHDLRHFYASELIAFGCDVATVQRAVRHATTTLNTYSHLWPTAADRTRRAADQLCAHSYGPQHPSEPLTGAAALTRTLKRNESGVI